MPWEKTRNGLTKKTLESEASEMRAANIEPIVLRWRTVLRTSQNVYGFYGCRTWTAEKLNGEMDISGEIDNNKICTFFPDEFRVGYAVIPKCKRNMDILAATLNDHPAWIIESPQDVVQEVKELAKEYPAVDRSDKMKSPGLGLPPVPKDKDVEPNKVPAKKPQQKLADMVTK